MATVSIEVGDLLGMHRVNTPRAIAGPTQPGHPSVDTRNGVGHSWWRNEF